MSDFKAKMHQIRFALGLRLRPCWVAYSTPPDPQAAFKGPTSEGRGPEGERKGKREGRGDEVEEGIWPTQIILAWRPLWPKAL